VTRIPAPTTQAKPACVVNTFGPVPMVIDVVDVPP
jgi:hypothetical protein